MGEEEGQRQNAWTSESMPQGSAARRHNAHVGGDSGGVIMSCVPSCASTVSAVLQAGPLLLMPQARGCAPALACDGGVMGPLSARAVVARSWQVTKTGGPLVATPDRVQLTRDVVFRAWELRSCDPGGWRGGALGVSGGGMGSGLCGIGCGQPSMAWIGRGPGSSGLGAARSAQGR